jgi:hypothetical protein
MKAGQPIGKYLNKHYLLGFFIFYFLFFISAQTFTSAQTTQTLNSPTTNVNVNDSGFKFVVCDGPDVSNVQGYTGPGANGKNPDGSTYIPCDFNGAMMQVQHLINIAIVLGVLAAIVLFSYAGFLYVTASGNPGKLSQAHAIFKNVAIGFILMLSAWFIVYQILAWLTGDGSGFSALLGNA